VPVLGCGEYTALRSTNAATHTAAGWAGQLERVLPRRPGVGPGKRPTRGDKPLVPGRRRCYSCRNVPQEVLNFRLGQLSLPFQVVCEFGQDVPVRQEELLALSTPCRDTSTHRFPGRRALAVRQQERHIDHLPAIRNRDRIRLHIGVDRQLPAVSNMTQDSRLDRRFFVSYNKQRGKKFKVLGTHGPKKAAKILEDGIKAFDKK
jgi:hypothetical protein